MTRLGVFSGTGFSCFRRLAWRAVKLKVSTLYIAQMKRKCGLEVGEHYNKSKKGDKTVSLYPAEKETAIMDALRHDKIN